MNTNAGRNTYRYSDVNNAMAQIRSSLKYCLIKIFKTYIAYFSGEMCYCYKLKNMMNKFII